MPRIWSILSRRRAWTSTWSCRVPRSCPDNIARAKHGCPIAPPGLSLRTDMPPFPTLLLPSQTDMSKVTDPKKAAIRARVIASDIAIYPDIQKKIARGIENDNLFEELDDVLREARQHFEGYVSADLCNNTNIFEKAFIDTVFAGTAHIESEIW